MLSGRDVSYGYSGDDEPCVVNGVTLEVQAGDVVAIVGASGSGKSTLLYCLAGVLQPRSGSVHLDGRRIDHLGAEERSRIRLAAFGFVFQFGALVPELSLAENVELPLRLLGTSAADARSAARTVLDELGVAEIAHRRPSQVSGGQQQRAGVARALVHSPRVVFADEPTGALDSASRDATLDLLVGAARRRGAAVVLVTHDDRVAERADRIVRLIDGRVIEQDRIVAVGEA